LFCRYLCCSVVIVLFCYYLCCPMNCLCVNVYCTTVTGVFTQLQLTNISYHMSQATISPIFRSTRLCVRACGIMYPRCSRPAISWVHYTTSCNTQSSAPEDVRDCSPTHVELIGIINKPLLLYLVVVYIIYINDGWTNKRKKTPDSYPFSNWIIYEFSNMYRVIHMSLRDFRTRLRNNQDRHGRKEHINR